MNLMKFAGSRSRVWIFAGVAILALIAGSALFLATSEARRIPQDPLLSPVVGTNRAFDPSPQTTSTAAGGFEHWKSRISSADAAGFPDLLREALQIGDAGVRREVLAALLTAWLDTDLAGFITFVDEVEVSEDGDFLWEQMSAALAAALPLVGEQASSNPQLAEIVRRLVEFAAVDNPSNALGWARQWLLDDALESALATISGELARTSPEDAIDVLAEIRSPARRVDSILGIGAAFAGRDPDAAVKWASGLEHSGERPYAMGSVLSALAETQPNRAAQELDLFKSALTADYSSQVRTETGSDPSAAFEGDPSDRESLPPPSDPRLVILSDASLLIAGKWAESAPEEAVAWVQGLPEGQLRKDMLGSALAGWAATDPKAALDYYRQHGALNPAAAEGLFEAWATASPAAAAKAAMALQTPEQRARATSGVVGAWMVTNPADAKSWADTLPIGQERDLANALIVEASSLDEPTNAWTRAQEIRDPAKRRGALEASFAGLLGEDPDAARSALQNSRLGSEESGLLARMLQSATGIISK